MQMTRDYFQNIQTAYTGLYQKVNKHKKQQQRNKQPNPKNVPKI